MRIVYLGYFSSTFPRNSIVRHGLEECGADVVLCRLPKALAPGHAGPGRSGISFRRLAYDLGLLVRALRRSVYVLRTISRLPDDVGAIVVAEFNQGLVPLAALSARRRGIPVIADFLISLWDTAVNARRALKPNRPRAYLRWFADKTALRLADATVFETTPQADYYTGLFRSDRSKAYIVPVGCADWRIAQTPLPMRSAKERRLVLFYGSFAPVHGIEWILRAARELENDPRFSFRLVGPDREHSTLVAEFGELRNVDFRAPKTGEIGLLIARADICLGSFGDVDILRRTVPTKVWECLAGGRPVVTADGPGPRSVFENERHLLLVPPADAESLVGALDRLARDCGLARRLAEAGAALVRSQYSSSTRGADFLAIIDSAGRKARAAEVSSKR